MTTVDEHPMRLDDAIAWFLDSWSHEGPRVPTADTVRDYGYALKWLVPFATSQGRLYVGDLDADLLRSAMKTLFDDGQDRSPLFKGGEGSVRTLISATRRLRVWLAAQGLVVADISQVRPPRAPERIQPRLAPEEFRQLEQAVLHQFVDAKRANPQASVARNLALLYLLADTGLRASEVVNMTTADVDFERVRIRVRHGKGRKERMLSILDPTDLRGGDTIRLLGEWLKVRSTIRGAAKHEYLFVSVGGAPFKREGLRRVLAHLCQDAGLPGHRPPHAFRRASFTERYRANPEAIDVLAARMGWSNKSHHMVNVYTRGAQLEFASEVALPSIGSLWSRGLPSARPTPPPKRRRASSHDRNALPDAVRSDPELRKELLQWVIGEA